MPQAALAADAALHRFAKFKGSNEWAAGAARSSDGHALLANDPHLTIRIPGVWYLVDLLAPGFHVAGAALAGTPGVILGHNDRVAWAATSGVVVSGSVYEASDPLLFRNEHFRVRFGSEAVLRYADDKHGFLISSRLDSRRFSVDWPAVRNPVSGLSTFERLDRAKSMEEVIKALRDYPGPTQNFAIADWKGRVAYQLAGTIPDDPVWGLRVHPATDPHYLPIPFERLPHVAPSRTGVVFTANNRMYGEAYDLRLSPVFKPPYRAARIAQLLRSRATYDVNYFAEMQRDTVSLPEREFAGRVVQAARRPGAMRDAKIAAAVRALASWDGSLGPSSRAATIANAVRIEAEGRFVRRLFPQTAEAEAYHDGSSDLVVMLRALRERPKGFFPHDDPDGFLLDALRDVLK
ncbi:MAG: penicillin acylase family protein, partial [Vulcanimicrobiaceae bacterium]